MSIIFCVYAVVDGLHVLVEQVGVAGAFVLLFMLALTPHIISGYTAAPSGVNPAKARPVTTKTTAQPDS